MSHQEQVAFFTNVFKTHKNKFIDKDIIEIGSLIINGSLRQIFVEPKSYLGVDIGQGPGVDIISKGHELDFANDSFDVALSAECLEHDQHWVQTFQKMIDLVKPNGMIVFSCATTGRPEHGTLATDPGSSPFTINYYRNLTQEDFEKHFDYNELFVDYGFEIEPNHHDLYFWGQVS